jgi:hypothetical protein
MDKELFENSELGEWAIFEGERIPLDFPMYNEAKKKKDPPIGKPMKNTGGGKKYKVYVRSPKTGKIKKVTYGDSKGGLVVLKATGTTLKLVKVLLQGISVLRKKIAPNQDTGLVEHTRTSAPMFQVAFGNVRFPVLGTRDS